MLARYMLRNKKHKNIFKKNPKNKNSTIYVNNMVRSESVDYFSFFKHLKEPVIIYCSVGDNCSSSVPHENHVIHPKIALPPSPL